MLASGRKGLVRYVDSLTSHRGAGKNRPSASVTSTSLPSNSTGRSTNRPSGPLSVCQILSSAPATGLPPKSTTRPSIVAASVERGDRRKVEIASPSQTRNNRRRMRAASETRLGDRIHLGGMLPRPQWAGQHPRQALASSDPARRCSELSSDDVTSATSGGGDVIAILLADRVWPPNNRPMSCPFPFSLVRPARCSSSPQSRSSGGTLSNGGPVGSCAAYEEQCCDSRVLDSNRGPMQRLWLEPWSFCRSNRVFISRCQPRFVPPTRFPGEFA